MHDPSRYITATVNSRKTLIYDQSSIQAWGATGDVLVVPAGDAPSPMPCRFTHDGGIVAEPQLLQQPS
jgi:hypothetical protein